MRCYCCNKNLSDFESSIKSLATGDYLDMCTKCLDVAQIPYKGKTNLEKIPPKEEDDDLMEFLEEDEE